MQRKAAKIAAHRSRRHEGYQARQPDLHRPARHMVMAALCGALLLLGACGPSDSTFPETPSDGRGRTNPNPDPNATRESIFGEGGLTLFGGNSAPDQGGVGIGVNSFLWRASLDTISFMPLTSADPFGGVIITDWYSDPRTPDERFKMTVYILENAILTRARQLRIATIEPGQE